MNDLHSSVRQFIVVVVVSKNTIPLISVLILAENWRHLMNVYIGHVYYLCSMPGNRSQMSEPQFRAVGNAMFIDVLVYG